MLTGEIRNQIDRIWDAFWAGGIANPLEVIEQITYLLFIRRLDDLHTLEENKARTTRKPMDRRIFPEGGRKAARPGAGLVRADERRPGDGERPEEVRGGDPVHAGRQA